MKNELTYKNVYQQFKEQFPDDLPFFTEKERETGVDATDGAHMQFGMVAVPYLYHLADISDETKIRKCFAFFDEMSAASDNELSAVVQFSILEGVVSNKVYLQKLKRFFTGEMKTYLPYLKSYIDFVF